MKLGSMAIAAAFFFQLAFAASYTVVVGTLPPGAGIPSGSGTGFAYGDYQGIGVQPQGPHIFGYWASNCPITDAYSLATGVRASPPSGFLCEVAAHFDAGAPNCTDSDGGMGTYVQGTVVAPLAGAGGATATDFCMDSTTLVEYYCNQDTIANATENCVCGLGACAKITGQGPSTAPPPVQPGNAPQSSAPPESGSIFGIIGNFLEGILKFFGIGR